MIKIGRNTTATKEVINKYQKFGNARLFPCQDSDNIDLVYIDNESKENFTLKSAIRNYNESILLKDGEMTLNGKIFLEILDI